MNLPTDQPALFDDAAAPLPPGAGPVSAAPASGESHALAARLGPRVHLGTSSWHFPGWAGRVPGIDAQLPMLRALWPGPLVCRWNLQRGLGYDEAKGLFKPFDKLCAPDPATRESLAKVVFGTINAGHPAYITINNKAEGSAPLSVLALARELWRLMPGSGSGSAGSASSGADHG